jgi:lipopolysaccharide export system permease protein
VKRLHVLVLKSFIGPFVLIFFIVLFILLMQFLWRYIDDLVGKGLELKVIAELLLYTSSSLVPMALPLSILMSSLMTFGNMGEFYELTAIKASGISLQRIMMPLIILVIFISIGAFFFANEVLPYTNLKMRSLLYDVRNQRPEIQILPGSFYSGIDGYSLRIERKNPSTNMLYDIKIYDHTQNRGNISITIADSGRMIITEDERDLIFTLYGGYSYTELADEKNLRRTKTYPHRFDRFDEERIIIKLVGFSLTRTDEDLFRNHYSMLDLNQLKVMEDSINKDIVEKEEVVNSTLILGNYFRKRTTNISRPQHVAGSLKNKPDSAFITEVIDDRKEQFKSRPVNKMNPDSTNLDSVHSLILRRKLKPGAIINSEIHERTDPYIYPESPAISKDMRNTNRDTAFYTNLFDRLTLKEKENVLSAAQSYSRSARTYIVSSAQTIDAKIKNLHRFEIEWQRKFTIAFACLVFLFIGAPLGAIIRKGGLGLPLVISTLFFIFYYVISLVGEKMVREGFLPDYQGMWLASFIFFIAGVFLTYKATTDAAMLNFETYAVVIRKYLGIKRTNILDDLKKEDRPSEHRIMKYDNFIASLSSFRDTISDTIEYADTRLKFEGFIVSLAGFRESSNIILFERLYKNIILSITRSEFMENKWIQNKLSEFPSFNYRNYFDLKWRLYLRLILLLIPPFTLVILGRHYIQLMSLKSKLRSIDQLIEDLILQVKKNMAFK